MKNTATHQVITLPTKKADDEVYSAPMYMEKDKLYGCYDINYNIRLATPQHLHIISNDEIKIDDKQFYFIELDLKGTRSSYANKVHFCDVGVTENFILTSTTNFPFPENCRRVIASTDKSITPNSWIPESFALAYVKAHGQGKPITEVDLEIIDRWDEAGKIGQDVENLVDQTRYVLNTRPDGSVIIHRAETYTKEQMINAIAFGRNLGMAHPEVNEGQAKIRNEAIQEFIDSDFKF